MPLIATTAGTAAHRLNRAPSAPLLALYKTPRAPSPNCTTPQSSSSPLQRHRRSATAGAPPLPLIRSSGAPPSFPRPPVSSFCPPLAFGPSPVKFGAREAKLAITGELRRRPPRVAAAACVASGPSDRGGRSRLKGAAYPFGGPPWTGGPGPRVPVHGMASRLCHACVSASHSPPAMWRHRSPSAGRPGIFAKTPAVSKIT
jgi:hypothetical protein